MRSYLLRLAALGVLLASLPALCADYARAPKKEEMLLDGNVVVVDYRTSATSDDLLLPFYPGASVENSFSYTVTTKEGKPVLYYALADLVSPDPPSRVAEDYRSKLPGKPKAEAISDDQGKRLVLAVGTEAEVRVVTITERSSGSRIRLVRATKPIIPEARPLPAPVQPQRPRRMGPGRRMRRGMQA
jgi:hypothetical protein